MPTICNLNISLGFYTANQDMFTRVRKKKIDGSIGSLFDQFFTGAKDPRNCEFFSVGDFGERLDNGSYTGVKKLFSERKLDLYCRFTNLMFTKEESLISISYPCYSEKIHFGQFANFPETSNDDSLALFEHSIILVNMLFIGFLKTIFFILFIQLLNYKFVENRTISIGLSVGSRFLIYINRNFFQNFKLLTKLNVIIIFFALFAQILFGILRSNIKTNEVIVNTSNFIDSKFSLTYSRRYPCGLKNEPIFDFVLNYEKNSELNRLIGQKRKPDQSICFLDSILGDRNSINKFELDESLFVMSKALVYFVFTFFKSRAHQKVLFETSFFEHELIQILYMNSLMKQTDRIQLTNSLLRSSESGHFIRLNLKSIQIVKGMIQTDHLYTDMKNLKDDFTKVETIKFEYFQNLFYYLFLIYLILFLNFISFHSFKFAIQKWKIVKSCIDQLVRIILEPFKRLYQKLINSVQLFN